MTPDLWEAIGVIAIVWGLLLLYMAYEETHS